MEPSLVRKPRKQGEGGRAWARLSILVSGQRGQHRTIPLPSAVSLGRVRVLWQEALSRELAEVMGRGPESEKHPQRCHCPGSGS